MAAIQDPAGFGLLRRAVGDALASAALATPEFLPAATPCSGWNLRDLLDHLSESLDVVREAITSGQPGPGPVPGAEAPPGPGPAAGLRHRAVRLLAACAAAAAEDELVTIAGHRLARSMIAEAGAVEVAVHGWDIRMACGDRRPVPAELAIDMLPLAPLLIPEGSRHGLFAEPVAVPRLACPGDHLVAFLGRRPVPRPAPAPGPPEPGKGLPEAEDTEYITRHDT